jgi:hypothetical protein
MAGIANCRASQRAARPVKRLDAGVVPAVDVARKLNSFREVDHAAVRGGAEPAVTHLAELALDDGCSRLVYGQVAAIAGDPGGRIG